MPDLLSHALIGYTLGRSLSWRYRWLRAEYITVVMAGAFIPDIAKLELVVPDFVVSELLGVPFDWFAFHTLGGVTLSILIGGALVAASERRRVCALLTVGAGSHLLADALLLNVTGRSFPILWPLTLWRPPSPGLYLSSDPEPALVLSGVALILWLLHTESDNRNQT